MKSAHENRRDATGWKRRRRCPTRGVRSGNDGGDRYVYWVPLGGLLEYGHAMGVILRCPQCDAPMLCMVRTPGWIRMDASGIALLLIPERPDVGAVRR